VIGPIGRTLCVAVMFVAGGAARHEAAAQSGPRARVIVTSTGQTVVSGALQRYARDTAVIRLGAGDSALVVAPYMALQVREATKRHQLRDALIGIAAGAAIGAVVGASTYSSCVPGQTVCTTVASQAQFGAVFGVIVGGLTGFLVGRVEHEQWRTLRAPYP